MNAGPVLWELRLHHMQEALFASIKIAGHRLLADAFAHMHHSPVPFNGQEIRSVWRANRAHGIQEVGGVEQETACATAAATAAIDAALIPISASIAAAWKQCCRCNVVDTTLSTCRLPRTWKLMTVLTYGSMNQLKFWRCIVGL